ncbi:MAG: ubiquinone biosynthesis regulatory protein kinase UbiB [Gammaproteobacteria bacterium]|nr:MAG: ubiquinone biosynthesis regulatory protein kinase UbiB [Gammaproteobacteria bacterium]
MIRDTGRFLTIQHVFLKYGLDELFLSHPKVYAWQKLGWLSPSRWRAGDTRRLPRGERLRLAFEELGPVFVKLGQMLSTRRDLLPDDIGDELAKLQDKVPPFDGRLAQQSIEASLGKPIDELFASFDIEPMASASIAQVHAIELHDGSQAIAKVLRPGIRVVIERDLGLMHTLANLAERMLPDGPRLHPRAVVNEYERTIRGELDLQTEASNAVVLKENFADSEQLYVPDIHWEYTRGDVLVQERIHGIPIREVETMRALGIDMQRLAENGVEVFYTQVFKHNFFHADMHPGNIFVSAEHLDNPQYIAVDFGIVGSLTPEDRRYIGENLLAFFERDYRRVAELHVESGWVPAYTRVSEFEACIRAVCEPILNKPLSDISFGDVLLKLFNVARRFEMEVQPQLVLLQKTLMNIEGLGRDLYPDLDLWETGKPHLRRWMARQHDPVKALRHLVMTTPEILETLPDMPILLHRFLSEQVKQGALGTRDVNALAASSRPGMPHDARGPAGERGLGRRLRQTIGAAAALVALAVIGGAHVLAAGVELPLWWWLASALVLICLLHVSRRD